jgi:uncharacterized membrane protein
MVMTRGKLLRTIDSDRIKEAIREAEKRTSGEICVSVSSLFWGDVRKAAEKAFVRMGMTATKERNAVLFFVVPARRKFVVLGDSAIHEKVGQDFWHHIIRVVSERFQKTAFTDGLIRGIAAVGEQLATHFPFDAARDANELPDDVDYGHKSGEHESDHKGGDQRAFWE